MAKKLSKNQQKQKQIEFYLKMTYKYGDILSDIIIQDEILKNKDKYLTELNIIKKYVEELKVLRDYEKEHFKDEKDNENNL